MLLAEGQNIVVSPVGEFYPPQKMVTFFREIPRGRHPICCGKIDPATLRNVPLQPSAWNKENAEALMSGFPRRAAALSPARALERAGAGPPGGGAVGAGDGVEKPDGVLRSSALPKSALVPGPLPRSSIWW